MRKMGRPRKLRVSKKARTKAFGRGARGARNPAQLRAAIGRETVRTRSSWRRSQYRRRR